LSRSNDVARTDKVGFFHNISVTKEQFDLHGRR
jgi:hypothetical protein